MAAMSASTMAVLAAPQVAIASSSDRFASRSSVAFNNLGGLRPVTVRTRSVRSLVVRAKDPHDRTAMKDPKLDGDSSTGGITDAMKEAAEKTAVAFDGVKEDVESKLKDAGRDLRSKTGDVVYNAQRNAEGVGADAQERANDAQTKYTKGK